MSDQITTQAAVTTTQKIMAVVGGAGMGLSISDVTLWLQLIGALTGAIVGCWILWDKVHAKFFARKGQK